MGPLLTALAGPPAAYGGQSLAGATARPAAIGLPLQPAATFEAALDDAQQQADRYMPLQSFDALGMFGRTGAASGNQESAAPVAEIEAARGSRATAGRPSSMTGLDQLDVLAKPAPAMTGGVVPSDTAAVDGYGAAARATAGDDLQVPAPTMQSATLPQLPGTSLDVTVRAGPTSCTPLAAEAESAPRSTSWGRTAALVPVINKPDQAVSASMVIEAGAIQVVMRSNDVSVEQRALLRRLIEQLAAEHDLTVAGVRLNGAPLLNTMMYQGVPDGHCPR